MQQSLPNAEKNSPQQKQQKSQPTNKQVNQQHKKTLQKWSQQDLINKVISLTKDNKRLQTRLAQFQPQKQKQLRDPNPNKLKKLFQDFQVRKTALKVCYIGISYDGMAVQADTDNTIEAYLFKILYTLSLIPEPMPGAGYTRAGRTDKGVSAMGNVVSLPLRTSIRKSGQNDQHKQKNTMNYCSMLNSLLPQDIRITAAQQVEADFNSRYHCTQRSYKYFFARNNLNIEKMRQAMQSFVGKHNFINYCKMNLANCVDFVRTIIRAQIHQADHSQIFDGQDRRNQIYYFYYVGNSFLWHQIRFMSSILFLVGSGQEDSSIVADLLNLQKYPRKPNYQMAPQYPLILEDCLYDNVRFTPDPETTYSFYNTFHEMVMRKSVEKTLFINCMSMARKQLINNIKLSQTVFIEQVQKRSQKLLSRKKKQLAIYKSSGKGMQEAIKSLKGKKLDMYQKKADKQAAYQEKRKKEVQDSIAKLASERAKNPSDFDQ